MYGPLTVHFGALVRELRRRRGLTQEEFARELEVTVGTMSGWETGKHRPHRALRNKVVRMAEKVGVEIAQEATHLAVRSVGGGAAVGRRRDGGGDHT